MEIPLLSQCDCLISLFEGIRNAENSENNVTVVKEVLGIQSIVSELIQNLKKSQTNDEEIISLLQKYNIHPSITSETFIKLHGNSISFKSVDFLINSVASYLLWLVCDNIQTKTEFGSKIISVLLGYCDVDDIYMHFPCILSSLYYIMLWYLKNNDVNYLQKLSSHIIKLFSMHNLRIEYTMLVALQLKLILASNPDDLSPDFLKAMGILHQYIYKINENAPPKIFQIVFCAITPLIYKLENIVLNFLAEVSIKLPYSIISMPVNLFPTAILQEIQHENLSFIFEEDNIPLYEDITRSSHDEIKLTFTQRKEIKIEEIDLSAKHHLPDRLSYPEIFNIEFLRKISLISKYLSSDLELISYFIETFFELFPKIEKEYQYHYLMAASLVFLDMQPTQLINTFIKKLYQSVIFDPRISIYHETEDSFISTARWTAFDILFLDSTDFIFDVLEILFGQPYMYSEFLLRLSIGQTYSQLKFKKEIIDTICEHLHEYKQEFNDQAPTARGNIILFISRLLTDTQYINNFFSSEYQTTIFLSGIFENSLQKFTIQAIRTYLYATEKFSKYLCNILGNCLDTCALSENGLQVYIDLLSSLNDVQKIRRQVAEYLIPLRQNLCSIICKVSHNNEFKLLETLLYQTLNFFTSSSQIIEATVEEVSSIETVISIFDGREIPDLLFQNTVQVIAGQFLSSYSPKFIIREPNFLRFFLKIYHGDEFCEAIKFIKDLCGYASQNIIICHNAKIDLLLIELLDQQRVLEKPDLDYVNSCLDLFKIIVSFISSVSVAQRYVSLFAPLSYDTVSYLQPVLIRALTDILQSSYRKPSGFLELKPGGQVITISGLNAETLNKPFCFCTWFRINFSVPKYSPNIFTISDSNGNRINATISCDELSITLRNGATKSVGKVEDQMLLNQWVFLGIMFIKFDRKIECHITLNNKKTYALPYPLANFGGEAKIVVGGAEIVHGIDNNKYVSMSSFGLINVNSVDQSSEIEMIGPHLDKTPQVSYNFFVRIASTNKVFNASLITPSPNISMTLSGTSSKQIPMIYDCLVNICGVDLILPLFALFDFKYKNGKPFEECIQVSYELLFVVIVNSEGAQKYMAESNCVEILEFLMMSADPKFITYNLYQKFYNIVQRTNYIGLQTKVSKNILLNNNLWGKSKPLDQTFILRSWHRKLLPFLTELGQYIVDFRDILTIFVTSKGDLTAKKILIDILIELANSKFTQNDLMVLISHVAKSSSKENCLLLLELIESLFILPNEPLKSLDCHEITNIIFAVGLRSSEITMKVINLLVSASKVLTNIHLYETFDYLLQFLRNDDASEEFHQFLFKLVTEKSVYELLPLLSWCSIILGGESVQQTFSSLLPNEKFACHPTWSTWPLIAAIIHPQKEIYVVNFLVDVSPNEWMNIDVILCYLEKVLKVNVEEIRRSFITMLTNNFLLKVPKEVQLKDFYFITIAFLLRHNKSQNKTLQILMKKFFNEEKIDDEKISNLNENFAPVDFYVNTNNYHIDNDNQRTYFGLRLQEESAKWTDLSLVNSLITVFMKYQDPKFSGVILFLLYHAAPLLKSDILTKFLQMNQQVMDLKSAEFKEKVFLTTQRIMTTYDQISLNVYKFYKNSFNDALHLIEMIESRYAQITYECITKLRKNYLSHINASSKCWSNLWHRMRTSHAPWKIADTVIHWKKAPNPATLLLHSNHDDHIDALIKREEFANSSEEVINNLKDQLQKSKSSKSILFDPLYESHSTHGINENKLIYTTDAIKIYLKKTTKCVFSIYKDGLKVVQENESVLNIPGSIIKLICPMKHDHKECAIEIEAYDGNVYMFAFEETNTQILSYLSSMTMKNGIIESLTDISIYTEKWLNYRMSTFDYLLKINKFAKRSFADITQYPVFPWVLSDYKSNELHLDDPNVFRDFSCAPCEITSKKKAKFEALTSSFELGRGISSPGEISAFLIRMEPFLTIKINYNGGNFDFEGQIFQSLQKEWDKFCDDPNDTRELIPELFSFPEMLLNVNHIQISDNLSNVAIPNYAKSAPEFIYLHRKALESDFVSENISKWIDITFGNLQRSSPSTTYRMELYDDILNMNAKDEFVNSICTNVGCIPKQVFTNPHPKREIKNTNTNKKARKLHHGVTSKIIGSGIHMNDVVLLTSESIIRYRFRSFDAINKGNVEMKVFYNKRNVEDSNNIIFFKDKFIRSNDVTQSIEVVNQSQNICIRGGIVSMSCDNNLLCVGTEGATCNVFVGDDMTNLCVAETFLGEVVCCAVSERYSIVVSCTSGSSIVINSLNGEYVQSIEIESVPIFVSISRNFGFIVVVSEIVDKGTTRHFINVYTVNGIFIRRKELDSKVIFMTTISNRNGDDFIVYVDHDCRVFVASCFYIDKTTQFMTLQGDFHNLHFIEEEFVICAITSTLIYVVQL